MLDFITLSCPTCGHKLQLTEDIDRFACAACGNEHIVNRSGGVITIKPLVDSINKVQDGVNKTSSELAIVRLREEINVLESEIYGIMTREIIRRRGGPEKLVSYGLVLFGVFCLMIAANMRTDLLVTSSIFGLILISFGIFLNIRFNTIEKDMQKRKKDQEAKPLKKKLEAKKSELAYHQEIVSRYK